MTKTALVVDDEAGIVDMMIQALSCAGYDCVGARCAADAERILSQQSFDVVITDVRMPGITGLQLLERLQDAYPDVHVILLTGSADVSTVVSALRGGAADFLTKPFSIDELILCADRAVAARSAAVRARDEEAQRQEDLNVLAERFDALSTGVVTSLARALGVKHPETRSHSERVALRAAQLAESLGVSADEVEAVYVAGLLHDVGKIAVDLSVLEKPGALDPHEFDQIRSHPLESARIVDPISLSQATVDAISFHHERFDGAGYPNGLEGEGIPLTARILAVCDAFDAMTSPRAYAAAVPTLEALDRLNEGAGSQWDPLIVECFCRNHEIHHAAVVAAGRGDELLGRAQTAR